MKIFNVYDGQLYRDDTYSIVNIGVYYDVKTKKICDKKHKYNPYVYMCPINDILANDNNDIYVAITTRTSLYTPLILKNDKLTCVTGKKILYADDYDIIYLDLEDTIICYDKLNENVHITKYINYDIVYMNKVVMYVKYSNRLHVYKSS